MPEAREVALAESAAPAEISKAATIYVLRDAGPMKVRDGSNGCTCMVSRDLHEGSLYPICFDQEASRSVFLRELLELRLRFEGKTEDEVKQAVAKAYTAGQLKAPSRPAVTYMMSPHQMLFSSPLAEGRRVGAWHPHLMISLPFATEAQLGLASPSSVSVFQLDQSGEPSAQLIVQLPQWSDGTSVQSAGPGPATPAAARDSLRLADQALSQLAGKSGLGQALGASVLSEAVLVFERAPVVQGSAEIGRLLAAQARLPGVSWAPYRVLVSSDRTLGVTFGGMTVEGRTTAARYITAWQRDAAGRWRIAAHMHNGVLSPDAEVVVPSGLGRVRLPGHPDPFSRADLDFAKLAADSGAPAAFTRFVAPDGMTFASTGELNIGPVAVGARLAEGRAGTAQWDWHPVFSIGAASGDLGITIGEAEIRLGGSEPATFYSQYLTVWQRQPDGTLKFVVDGGNSRPH